MNELDKIEKQRDRIVRFGKVIFWIAIGIVIAIAVCGFFIIPIVQDNTSKNQSVKTEKPALKSTKTAYIYSGGICVDSICDVTKTGPSSSYTKLYLADGSYVTVTNGTSCVVK